MCLPLTFKIDTSKMTFYHIGRLVAYVLLATFFYGLKQISLQFFILQAAVGLGFFFYTLYMLVSDWKSSCRASLRKTSSQNAFTVGFLNGCLPCAWLSVFLFSLMIKNSLPQVILLMCIFWLGTVPVFHIKINRLKALKYFSFLQNKAFRSVLILVLMNCSLYLHFSSYRVFESNNDTNPAFCWPFK